MAEDVKLYVAGLRVSPLPVGDAVTRYLEDAVLGRGRVYAFVNGQSAVLRRGNADYARVLEHPDVCGLVDGAAVELAARLVANARIPRSPGPDFFEAVVQAADTHSGARFFLLGGAPGVADRLRDILSVRYPEAVFTGVACPPYGEWGDDVSRALVEVIQESGANALWLGVSAPKQEVWALDHVAELQMPIACVGAAFDFLAGIKPRAPRLWRRMRLEWLFRLITEPNRLWYRYLVGNTIFIADALRFRARPPK